MERGKGKNTKEKRTKAKTCVRDEYTECYEYSAIG